MKARYLGDSYDLVKRYWAEKLREIAPLYAHPQFVPSDIRDDYKRVVGVEITGEFPASYGLLLDPDTGIPAPDNPQTNPTFSHAPLPYIVKLIAECKPEYVICYDQSYHRNHRLSKEQQRDEKRRYLRKHKLDSFYYVSHAPFLFLSSRKNVLGNIRKCLRFLGIPDHRFEDYDV